MKKARDPCDLDPFICDPEKMLERVEELKYGKRGKRRVGL